MAAMSAIGPAHSLDLQGLERLRQSFRSEAPSTGEQNYAQQHAKNRVLGRQLESVFLQLMLKRMREATPRTGLLESDQTRLVQSLADEQLALQLSNPGIGLAEAVIKQIEAQQGGADDRARRVEQITDKPAVSSVD